jgi:hypothetical protein
MRKFLDSDFKVILDKYADDEQVAKTGKKLINKYFDGCEAPEPLRNSVTEQTVALSFVITQLSAYHQSKPDKLKPEQMLRIIFAAISLVAKDIDADYTGWLDDVINVVPVD